MSYTKKIARGTVMIFLMSMLANFIGYFTRMILAKNLSPYDFGLFYSVFTFIIFFLFFRDLGLGQAMVKYIAEFIVKKNYNAVKTIIVSASLYQFISSVIFGAVFFFSADFLGKYYFKDPLAALVLKILVLYVVFSILHIMLKSSLQGLQQFKIFSLFDTLKNLIVLLLILFFFAFGFKNVFAPVYAYVLVCIISFLILVPFFLKVFSFFKYKITNFSAATKQLFLFGLPVLLTGIGGKVIGYIDTLMLTYFRSLEEVGIYNVILPSAMIFLYIGMSASAVVFPIVSELWAKKDKKKLSEGLRLLHKYAFAATVPMVFTVFTFSTFFINLFFSKEYVSGALAFKILLVGVLFYIVASINNNIISAIGRPQTVTKIILLSALVNAGVNLILIPKWGIEGAALATSLSYLVGLALSTYKVTKIMKVEFPKMIWIKIILAGIVFVAVITFIKILLVLNPWIELIIASGAATAVYLSVIYLLKIVDISEIKKYLMLVK